jgi:hypothetical protein
MTRHALAWLMAWLLAAATGADAADVRLSPDPKLRLADLPRYGLNIGAPTTFGAEQLRANVLANPGFEAVLDSNILILAEADPGHMVDDNRWLARPDGFWIGARFSVRSGAAAGQDGQVADSRARPRDGLGEFLPARPVPGLRRGDVVSVVRRDDPQPAALWWSQPGQLASAPGDVRPGSPGRQSLRLKPPGRKTADLVHYLDNIQTRAGRLLPVRGPWRLSLWARAPGPGARLRLSFERMNAPPFVAQEVAPGPDWREYRFDFRGPEIADRSAGAPGPLILRIQAQGGEVRVDDAYLGEAEPHASGFRREAIAALKTLNPGYLRDWQGQSGDALDNRLAPEFARQPVRHSPNPQAASFHYGLPDFLALCAEVGARPWVVAPTTLSDPEWRRLGAALRAAADRHGFDEILVEFGNENWNSGFRPTGIADPGLHGAVADRGFALLKAGAGQDRRLRAVANAHFAVPDGPRRIGAASAQADRVAVAPYFLYELNAGVGLDRAVAAGFEADGARLRDQAAAVAALGKGLSVYEVNFHTTQGSAPPELRNRVVAGAASGPALARQLLQGSLAGAREQAVFTFAGFDNFVEGQRGLVRLWGVTRDLAGADRLRPTGEALALLNRVAGGPARAGLCGGPDCAGITALYFDDGRRLALVSALSHPTQVAARLPCAGNAVSLDLLDGSRPERDNELRRQVRPETVTLACRDGEASFGLPPYSLAVLHDPVAPHPAGRSGNIGTSHPTASSARP